MTPEQTKIASLQNIRMIFEIGCDAMEESTPFLRESFPEAEIYCFDPDPRNHVAILQNQTCTKLNAHFYPLAIGEAQGLNALYLSTDKGLSSSLKTPKRLTFDTSCPVNWVNDPIPVCTASIDLICDQLKIDYIDLVHMDVQSSEDLVLNGATLMLPRIHYIFTEHNTAGMYENEPGMEGILNRLPGWKILNQWPYDMLLENPKFNDNN